MKRGGAGKRRDSNEPAIVQALRAIGCHVWQINGAGLPDLLVCFRGRFFCGEVKTATGRLTRVQQAVAGPWPIWRTIEDALETVTAGKIRTKETAT